MSEDALGPRTPQIGANQLIRVLLAENFSIQQDVPPRVNCDQWNNDDYKRYAEWLYDVVNGGENPPGAPTKEMYQRAYYLGLGPEVRRITRRFGSLWHLNDIMQFEGGYRRGKFDDWSTRDFIEYGKELVKQSEGKKPTERILYASFKYCSGPSPRLIRTRIGGIGRFQELLGFPYIADWSENDYVEYGARILRANPGIKLTRYVFDELSQRQRGPAVRTLVNHFSSLNRYKELAISHYLGTEVERQMDIEDRAALLEQAVFPPDLWGDDTHDVKSFMSRSAAYLLVQSIFPKVAVDKKINIASVKASRLIKTIRQYDPTISAGTIESQAIQLGIFDDIWPLDDYLEHLQVMGNQAPKILSLPN